MRRCKVIPRIWLVTDERMGDALLPALERLPRDSGILFRHYSLSPIVRRALFDRVRRIAVRRGQFLLLAGPPALARAWGADGAHGSGRRSGTLLLSRSVHDLAELRAAARDGIDLVFLSPVFPTRSHPGQATLGPRRFALIARQSSLPVIALGGMDASRARRVRAAYGWAAIDAWLDHD